MSLSAKARTPAPSARVRAKPSLRWRIRRWILTKLDAWPRERPEPTTEWGRLRRADRERLVRANQRLVALEDRLLRWLDFMDDPDGTPRSREFVQNARYFVIDGHLDEMLADVAREDARG